MSHSIQPIPVVALYFDDPYATPVIAQAFKPGRGWRAYPMRKRISGAYLRTLRADGITSVALNHNGRTADFTVAELAVKTGLRACGEATELERRRAGGR